MSRVAKKPIIIPSGVEVSVNRTMVKVKGAKGTMQIDIREGIEVKQEDNQILLISKNGEDATDAIVGTTRALVNNMVNGVTKGFARKLILIGVGFKAQVQGKVLHLTLGFSHPILFQIPVGITIEAPSQTEIVVKGVDKHLVGQAAAEIRSFRPPEPYKGKGVRYEGEVVVQKEGKKK